MEESAVGRAYAYGRAAAVAFTRGLPYALSLRYALAGIWPVGCRVAGANGGPAHNFQIYVQMFLAKRSFQSLSLSLFFSRPLVGKISIVKFRGIEKCFRSFLALWRTAGGRERRPTTSRMTYRSRTRSNQRPRSLLSSPG